MNGAKEEAKNSFGGKRWPPKNGNRGRGQNGGNRGGNRGKGYYDQGPDYIQTPFNSQKLSRDIQLLKGQIKKFHDKFGQKTPLQIARNEKLTKAAFDMETPKGITRAELTQEMLMILGEKTAMKLDLDFNQLTQDGQIYALKIMLADDLPGLLKMAASAIIPHIPKLWEYAKKIGAHIKSDGWREGIMNSGREILNDIIPSIARPMPTFESAFDEVDIDYLMSLVDPTKYIAQAPYLLSGAETCITRARSEVQLVTNSNGNVIFSFFPYGSAYGVGTNAADIGYLIKGDNSLAPLTGIQDQTAYITRGQTPIFGASAISEIRATAVSLQFVATDSLINAKGKVEMGYFNERPNNSWFVNANTANQAGSSLEGNVQNIGQNDIILKKSYYVQALSDRSVIPQMTSMPPDGGEQSTMKPWNWPVDGDTVKKIYDKGAVMAIIVTGAQPNTTIGTVVMVQNVEFVPDASGLKILLPKAPPSNVRTVDVYNVMKSKFPRLSVLNSNERCTLIEILSRLRGKSYLEIINGILAFSTSTQTYTDHFNRKSTIGSFVNVEPSFDQILE